MLKFIIKRILMMIPVLIGVSFLIFAIMSLTPGDPASLKLGEGASREEINEVRQEMGLNENFFVRYGKYIADAVRGDFGKSYITGVPVNQELFSRFPTTLRLSIGAMIIMIVIGLPVGIISAVKQYSIIDNISLLFALILASIPVFWLGLMLVLVFSLKLDWLPATGGDSWINFVLPCITLSAEFMAQLVRMTRSSMLEVIRQDYVRTAKSKGASEKRVIFKHALRNALLPIITVIGLNFGAMIGGAILVEAVFALPGIGTMLITSIRMKDTPSVMACVLFTAFCVSIINLVVDILYTFIDPRLKSEYSK